MNVLSLFDGMSCGQIALERAGIKVDKYFASEVDDLAIDLTNRRYPKTIQLGDVTKIEGRDFEGKVDLLMGGSPCQGFSSIGNQLNFDHEESKLFFDYVRILNEVKPKWFLLENVMMKKEYRDIITEYLKVEPIKINSNLVSAQNRIRLYWTNIPNVTQPEDKGIFIEDIVEDTESVTSELWLPAKNTCIIYGKVDFSNAPKVAAIDVYNKKVKTDRKVPTLRLPHHNALRLWQDKRIRKFSKEELEELQNIPPGYTQGLRLNEAYALLGNGWTVDVITHIIKGVKK